MDKETLSNYGWIVICVMVLAVMLAFASPFGNFVANAIKSTTQGLFDTNQNALDSAGIEIMQQEFEEMLNGPSATDSPVKFGQPYQMTMDGMLMEYVFYADGSATMWMDAMGGYLPAGSVTYTETEVILEGDPPIKISADGTYLYDPEDETLKMTVKSVSKGSPKTNTQYIADPNGLIGITGVDIQIGTDGSITIYQNGVAGESIPASAIQWFENYYTIDGEIAGAIYPDGSKITIEGIVYAIVAPRVIPDGHTYYVLDESAGNTMNTPLGEFPGYMYIAGDPVPVLTPNEQLGLIISPEYTVMTMDGKICGILKVADSTKTDYAPPETICYMSVAEVYGSAFSECTQPVNLVLPKTVTKISFNECKNLRSVVLPEGMERINDHAFDNCTNLVSVTIPNSVKEIGHWAFSDCALTSVNIPNSVTKIGHYAFERCNSLKNVVIPDSVVIAEYDAFSSCENLETIHLGKSFQSQVDTFARNCDNLTSITVSEENKYFSSENGVLYNKNKTALYKYPAKTMTSEYVVPDSVTTIYWGAFENCKNMVSIKIHDSVKTIDRGGSLEDCVNLSEIIVDANNPYYHSIDGVLFSKSDNELVVYPRNKADSTYTIPNFVASIRSGAFSGCTNLKTVVVPDTFTLLDYCAFDDCYSLTTIYIPNTITSFEAMVLCGCENLTDIHFSGTKAEWNAITKGSMWDYDTPRYTVHCIDGNLAKS